MMELKEIINITKKVSNDQKLKEIQDELIKHIFDLIKDENIDPNSEESRLIISRIKDYLNVELNYKVTKLLLSISNYNKR